MGLNDEGLGGAQLMVAGILLSMMMYGFFSMPIVKKATNFVGESVKDVGIYFFCYNQNKNEFIKEEKGVLFKPSMKTLESNFDKWSLSIAPTRGYDYNKDGKLDNIEEYWAVPRVGYGVWTKMEPENPKWKSIQKEYFKEFSKPSNK